VAGEEERCAPVAARVRPEEPARQGPALERDGRLLGRHVEQLGERGGHPALLCVGRHEAVARRRPVRHHGRRAVVALRAQARRSRRRGVPGGEVGVGDAAHPLGARRPGGEVGVGDAAHPLGARRPGGVPGVEVGAVDRVRGGHAAARHSPGPAPPWVAEPSTRSSCAWSSSSRRRVGIARESPRT
jgi:hypothetical protein